MKDFGAVGDGCNDDTAAIQSALDLLKRSGTQPGPCSAGEGNTEAWDPWPVAVYFPAGIYRITAPLKPPFAQSFRLFGDGGRGGSFQGGVPVGTVIRQDADDQPILFFQRNDSYSFVIERLGFTWKNPQGPPPPPEEPNEPRDPGAVGVLSSYAPPSNQPPPQLDHAGYYHVRVTECWFRDGWRGVALDDRAVGEGGFGIPLALWDSQIDHCGFQFLSGAGVRLSNAPGLFFGMPGNALRSLFVANDDQRQNGEPQIMVTKQGGSVLDSLDLENSFHAPTLHVTGQTSLRNVYFEHLTLQEPNLRVVYLGGDNALTLQGLFVDGSLNPEATANPGSVASIIHCDAPSLVLSGARGVRTNDPAKSGIYLPDGDAFLVTGATETQVQLVGEPYFPNPSTYPYEVRLWSESRFGTSDGGNVVARPVREPVTLTGASVAPQTAATETVTVEGARRGDVVSLGAPPDLPSEVIFSGVAVADDTVEIRLFNTAVASAQPADASGTWYVTAGNGPHAGDAQIV